MLFVSIKFSLEKDSVVFSAFVNYNIMLCIEFSSLRLKCDMGYERSFLVLLCKQEGFTGLLEACLGFNKMSPKISEKL